MLRSVAPTTAAAARIGQRSFGEVRLDRDGQRQQPGHDEVEQRERAGPGVLGLVADEEREQAGQEEAQREAVAEPRLAQQVRGPEPQPAGRPDRAGQVPGAIERLVPAARRGDRLAAGADAVEDHAERPDQLEPAAPLAPLVEQRDREDERQDRGQGGQDDGWVHAGTVSWNVAIRRRRSLSSSPEASW